MPLPLIAAGASMAIGGISSFMQGKKAKAAQDKYNAWIEKQRAEADATYAQAKNENYLNTAEGRGYMTTLKTTLEDRDKVVDNSAVKTGASAESKIAQKESSGKTFSDGVRAIAGQGTQRKDAARREYMAEKSHLNGLKGNMMQQEIGNAQTSSQNAINNGMGAAMSIASADWGGEGGEGGGFLKGLFKKGGMPTSNSAWQGSSNVEALGGFSS